MAKSRREFRKNRQRKIERHRKKRKQKKKRKKKKELRRYRKYKRKVLKEMKEHYYEPIQDVRLLPNGKAIRFIPIVAVNHKCKLYDQPWEKMVWSAVRREEGLKPKGTK